MVIGCVVTRGETGLVVPLTAKMSRRAAAEGLPLVVQTNVAPVTGLVVNVLIYFLVGLALISQVRLELLAVRWQAQGVRTPANLTQRWVRYTLTFVVLAGLLAFVLPTGYTLGTLGVLGGILFYVLGFLWLVVFLLVNLMLLPISWLGSLLRGNAVPPTLPAQPPPPPPPDLTSLAHHPLPPWVDTLRDIFVILVIILILYLLHRI